MPAKLNLNLKYIQEQNLLVDIAIIVKTISKIVGWMTSLLFFSNYLFQQSNLT